MDGLYRNRTFKMKCEDFELKVPVKFCIVLFFFFFKLLLLLANVTVEIISPLIDKLISRTSTNHGCFINPFKVVVFLVGHLGQQKKNWKHKIVTFYKADIRNVFASCCRISI